MIRVGMTVRDHHGRVGRVVRLHDDFSAAASGFLTLTARQWLDLQEVPFTAEQLAEMWATLGRVEGKGAWLSPLSLLRLTDERGES